MIITVNGKQENITTDNLMAYVKGKKLNAEALVVELNGRVIVADRWSRTLLSEGDTLEILSFVGGG